MNIGTGTGSMKFCRGARCYYEYRNTGLKVPIADQVRNDKRE